MASEIVTLKIWLERSCVHC